jgi:hypothetical protein
MIVLAMIQLNQGLPSHRIWLFSPWYNWIKDYHLIVHDCSRHDTTESRTTISDSVISWLVNILWSYLLCVVLDSVISWLVNLLWAYFLLCSPWFSCIMARTIIYDEMVVLDSVVSWFSPWYNWIKDYHLIVYDYSRHDITESRTTISSYMIVLAMIQRW